MNRIDARSPLPRAALLALTLPLLAAAASCRSSSGDTAIAVHVVSDESLALDAVDVTAQFAASAADGAAPVGLRTAHFPNPASVTWVLTPSGPDKMFSIEVVARGMKGSAPDAVVSQRAVIAFEPGRRVDVTMFLSQACVGHACAPALTCAFGACVDPTEIGTTRPDGGVDGAGDGRGAGQDRAGDADDGRGDLGPSEVNTNRPIGDPCTASTECASNQCVDGVCCDDVCGGSCQQCDGTGANRGHCVAIAAGQPAPAKRAPCAMDAASTCHQTGVCDGKGSCQLYPDGTVCKTAACDATANTITESRCDGLGMCKAGLPLSCAPFRCEAGDTMCARTCMANTDCDGQPCVAMSCGKLKIAAACTANADCEMGHCVDKVCCDVDCTGQCQACNLSNSVGTCSNVRNGQPVGGRTPCAGTGTCGGSCMGQAGCTFPDTSIPCRAASCDVFTLTEAAKCNGSGACPGISTMTCPRNLRCQAGTAVCLGQCAATADCQPGFYCSGTTCTATKTLGAMCNVGMECGSGNCADSHCCNSACNGACQVCDASGSCGAIKNTEDAAGGCSGARYCDGGGVCQNRITEFTIPTANSKPYDIVAGPDGNLWFSESGATKVGRITTAGVITEVSTAAVSAQFPTALAAEPSSTTTKRVWFITQDMLGGVATAAPTPTAMLFSSPGAGTRFRDVAFLPGSLRVDMTDGFSGMSEFIPSPPPGFNNLGNQAGNFTNQIAVGPDGRMWFTGTEGLQMILSVNDPSLGITEFGINVGSGVDDMDLATGPDGNIWFIRPDPNNLNTLLEAVDAGNGSTVKGTTIAPGVLLHNARLARGPGNTMFFTDGTGSVSRVDATSLAIRTFVTPTASSGAQGITLGPDGNIWFTELGANKIGRLVPP